MAPKLRRLSGAAVVRILHSFGFLVVNIRGSHAKLRRTTTGGDTQILTVPLHKQLAPGTLHAVYRQAARFVPEDLLRSQFFSA